MQHTIDFIALNLTKKNILSFHANVKVGLPDDCWEWQNVITKDGYGRYDIRRNSKCHHFSAHRLAYFLHTSNDPAQMCVCHHCDNPKCCNPNHLFLGTIKDNSNDKVKKGRQAKGATHGSRTKPERVARGDRSGSRLHPERLRRGDNHHWRLHPELIPRGDRNGRRKHPERYPVGDDHYTRKFPEKVMRGESNANSILTIDQVLEIRHAFDALTPIMSQREAARFYGVNRSTIVAIIKRRNWKHI